MGLKVNKMKQCHSSVRGDREMASMAGNYKHSPTRDIGRVVLTQQLAWK